MELSQLSSNVICAFEKGYRVNSKGDAISPYGGRILRLGYSSNKISKYRYYVFTIKNYDNDRRTVLVHKLVAYQKFGIDAFKDGIHIRHLNGNSLDNSYDNIEIGTASSNMMDKPKEVRDRCSITASAQVRKFTDDEVLEMKEKHKNGVTYNELMSEYGITSKGTMSYIINNKYKTVKK